MDINFNPTNNCNICLREKIAVKPCMTKLACGSCKLYYYKQIELVIKSLLKTFDLNMGKTKISEFIASKTKLFIDCEHWDDSVEKQDSIDDCRFCKTRMVIFGFEGRVPKTKSSVLNPAGFKQIVFEFPGVVKMLQARDVKTISVAGAKKNSEIDKIVGIKQEFVSTQISRVCDSGNFVKIIDKINQILFSVHLNEETKPFLKNYVCERYRLTCPTTKRA